MTIHIILLLIAYHNITTPPTAQDVEDGNITDDIIVTGDIVNTNLVGTYNIIYKVTDSDGNESTKTRVVNIINEPEPNSNQNLK